MTTYAFPIVVSPPARGSVATGTLLAVLAVPFGVAAWVVIWSLGFIAGIVTFGVAVAATWLYRKGSRSAMTASGAFIVSLIVLATLVLGLITGLGVDYVRAVGEQNSLTWTEVLDYPQFWQFFAEDLPALVVANTSNILVALAFAAVGLVAALRTAFKRDAPVGSTTVSATTGPVATQTSLFGPITPAKEMPQLPEEQWISYRPPVAEQQASSATPRPTSTSSARATAVLTGPVPIVKAPVAPAAVAAPVAPAPVAAPVLAAEPVVELAPVPVTTSFAPQPVEEAPKAPRHRL